MTTLTRDHARTIIDTALARARDEQLKPLAVAVLDAGGHLVAFEREDGASTGRYQIASAKARGALAFGVGSRGLAQMAADRPAFLSAAGTALGGELIPVPGGVLVEDAQGDAIGAVGVSGDTSDNDESVAVAGIEAAGFRADTG